MTQRTVPRGAILTAPCPSGAGGSLAKVPPPLPATPRAPAAQRARHKSPSVRTQVLVACGFIAAVTVAAVPRFRRDGMTLTSVLFSYNDLSGRFAQDDVVTADEILEASAGEEVRASFDAKLSPLQELMARTDLWERRKRPESLSKAETVAMLKKLAKAPVYSHPRPGSPGFEEVKRKVLKIIRTHGKKGVDMDRLAAAIVNESRRLDYDPLFVAAVIKSESAFNSFATSHVGAKGLMQIMPETGKYVASLESFPGMPRGSLTDPGYNLRLGITYLKHLEELYGGNRVLTLIAYNWGPGHVEKTMKGQKRGVPRSVVNYALRILGDHSRWRQELHGTRMVG